jgi:kumamolisin
MDQILISIYLRRDVHDNGMTLLEYANAVIDGAQPVLEHDQFVYQFGSIQDELNLVVNWAINNSLTIVEASSGIATVKVLGTLDQLSSLFSVQLRTETTNDTTYVTHDGGITIPSEINDVVELVAGLDNSFSFTHSATLSPDGDLSANSTSVPNPIDLAKAYKFPSSTGSYNSQGNGVCVAILELGGGYTAQNITSTFSRIGLPDPILVDVSVDGGTNRPAVYDATGASGEVMLDIYCVGAVSPAAKIAMYFSPNTFQGFIDCIIACATDTVNNPSVISISWGTTDSNWSVYRVFMEFAFATAVAKGITVFVAAGDYGVRAVSGGATYTVQYPATSPYVVCAGGSVISINTDYSIASEVPWGTSGGGFAGGGGVSSIFSVPSWQSGFSSKTYPGGTVTSLTGRGIPDVSAMATGYTFYWYNYTVSGSPVPNAINTFVGTSATAPLLAGMMARLNQLTGRRIGFVNADWYSARTTAFNDLTTGDNHGGNTVGYMGTTGWDAASGLGTPIGTAIYALYKKGSTFPKLNNGFRPTTGAAYPRRTTGVR